jgi:hypothetical protein
MPTPGTLPSPQGKSVERPLSASSPWRRQRQLLDDQDVFHSSIESKLFGRLHSLQFEHFQQCGRDSIVRQCRSCRACKVLTFHCDLKWCPRCQWRITRARERVLTAWAVKLEQPKHLVLTQSNFAILTRKKIRGHQRNLARLRRTKAFREVKGGCVSVELTNESRGWHLHSHWLIDCHWLDMPAVCKTWGSLVGQEYAIAKITDVRDSDYIREVSKYVAKGSEIAGWKPEHILEFVTAIRGVRFFFSFGNLWKLGPTIREELKAAETPGEQCDCGACDFSYMPEQIAVLHELRHDARRR